MFSIPRIESSEFYLKQNLTSMENLADKAKKEISKRFESVNTKDKTKEQLNLEKRKDLELEKIKALNFKINIQLKKVISNFPKFKRVDEIYHKLISTSKTSVKTIDGALKDLQQIIFRADEITDQYAQKIKYVKTNETLGFLMKKYLGKISSLYKKNSSAFSILAQARDFLNKMPKFEDCYTITIAGFPNVGKSTLMKNISGSNVEIQDYPFTTKGLMFGYLYEKEVKEIQLIDTPGLLNRKKSNDIEKRAEIIIYEYAQEVIYVLDLTQSCGYDIESQLRLLKEVEKTGKTVTIYLSKTDIYNEEDEERLLEIKNKIKKFKQFNDYLKLKEFIIDNAQKLKRFDIRKIGMIK